MGPYAGHHLAVALLGMACACQHPPEREGQIGARHAAGIAPADTPLTAQAETPLELTTSAVDTPSTLILHPHEPMGYVKLTSRGFDERVEQGWKDRGDRRFEITEDASAPISPPHVGTAHFPSGYEGGRGPINAAYDLHGYRTIYLSFWLKLGPTWRGAPFGGINKVLHVWIGGGSKAVFALLGRNSQPLLPQFRMQNMRRDRRGGSYNLSPNRRTSRVTSGRWYHFEAVLTSNTPGLADGTVQWWVDGSEAGYYSGLSFVGLRDSPEWERISWNPTWGSPHDKVGMEMTMSIDHFYISGAK